MYATQIYDESGETIATAAWYPIRIDDRTVSTNREANARLMASAPELLAAAKPFALFDWISHRTLSSPGTDEVEVRIHIVGTSFETKVTVGDIKTLCASVTKATDSGSGGDQ